MMKCEEIRNQLSAHECGDLSADESRELQEHLAECPTCRAHLAAVQALQAGIRGYLREPLEYPDVTGPVMSLLRKNKKPARLVYAWVGGICVAATIIMGLYLHRPSLPAKPTASNPPVVTTAPEKRIVGSPRVVRPQKPAVIPKDQPRVRRLPTHKHKRPDANARGAEPAVEQALSSTIRLVNIEVTRIPADLSGKGERTSITTTFMVSGLTLSHTEERIVIPVEPNEDAGSIERPPLETVVVPKQYGPPGEG